MVSIKENSRVITCRPDMMMRVIILRGGGLAAGCSEHSGSFVKGLYADKDIYYLPGMRRTLNYLSIIIFQIPLLVYGADQRTVRRTALAHFYACDWSWASVAIQEPVSEDVAIPAP